MGTHHFHNPEDEVDTLPPGTPGHNPGSEGTGRQTQVSGWSETYLKMDPHLTDVLKCVTMDLNQCVLTVTHPLDLLEDHLRVLTAPQLPVMVPHPCVLMAALQTPLAALPAQEDGLAVLMD